MVQHLVAEPLDPAVIEAVIEAVVTVEEVKYFIQHMFIYA